MYLITSLMKDNRLEQLKMSIFIKQILLVLFINIGVFISFL